MGYAKAIPAPKGPDDYQPSIIFKGIYLLQLKIDIFFKHQIMIFFFNHMETLGTSYNCPRILLFIFK